MSHRLHTLSLSAALAASLPTAAFAADLSARSFQNPATAGWGGQIWSRGAPGTLYAGWDIFDSISDRTPDLGRHNADTALFMAVSPATFLTGSRNLYSFSQITAFDALIVPTQLDPGLYTVAVQIAVLGRSIDPASLTLNGEGWSSRTVLRRGEAALPPGHVDTGAGMGGVDNEYLFVWSGFERLTPRDIFAIDFRAAGTSNSLAAFSIDVGPAVPLPAAVWLLGPAVAGLGLAARRRGT
ncbi:MAG TPA: hypothetical protein DCY89_06180 [Gammaproteobacteria bacterium]|nr:hypothetical protein [Gammaproteobacteria bacterium]